MQNYIKNLVGYFVSVPNLSKMNAVKGLPSLIDRVPVYERMK